MINYILKKTFYINKEYNIVSSLVVSLIFYTSINIILSTNTNSNYLKFVIIVLYPMLILQELENIIYNDFYNGEIEIMITLFSTKQIIFYQFCMVDSLVVVLINLNADRELLFVI